MNYGKELDILIATKIMGLEYWPGRTDAVKATFVNWGFDPKPCIPPEYSTDIAAAWKVVEKLNLFFQYELHRDKSGRWQIGYGSDSAYFNEVYEGHSAPHVICLAALDLKKEIENETV